MKKHWLVETAEIIKIYSLHDAKNSITYQFMGATGNILESSDRAFSQKGKEMTILYAAYEEAIKIIEERFSSSH